MTEEEYLKILDSITTNAMFLEAMLDKIPLQKAARKEVDARASLFIAKQTVDVSRIARENNLEIPEIVDRLTKELEEMFDGKR